MMTKVLIIFVVLSFCLLCDSETRRRHERSPSRLLNLRATISRQESKLRPLHNRDLIPTDIHIPPHHVQPTVKKNGFLSAYADHDVDNRLCEQTKCPRGGKCILQERSNCTQTQRIYDDCLTPTCVLYEEAYAREPCAFHVCPKDQFCVPDTQCRYGDHNCQPYQCLPNLARSQQCRPLCSSSHICLNGRCIAKKTKAGAVYDGHGSRHYTFDCHDHTDCYPHRVREPIEWACCVGRRFSDITHQWTDKGCHCDAQSHVCVIERYESYPPTQYGGRALSLLRWSLCQQNDWHACDGVDCSDYQENKNL